MEIKKFYRIGNEISQQGLWYTFNGDFTGLIHNDFDFCKNNKLKMPFDNEIVGYLSATETLEELFNWFTKKDIENLQKHNWCIHIYESSDYKFYEPFQHWLINQNNLKFIKTIIL